MISPKILSVLKKLFNLDNIANVAHLYDIEKNAYLDDIEQVAQP